MAAQPGGASSRNPLDRTTRDRAAEGEYHDGSRGSCEGKKRGAAA
jgi:hypothetical protein